MKHFINIILLLAFLPVAGWTQCLINKGVNIKVASGTVLAVKNGYTNASNGATDGAIGLAGTMQVSGNWINNNTNGGTAVMAGSTGTVVLNGTSSQTIGGTASTAFPSLTLSNPAGAVLGTSIAVDNTFTFSTGSMNLVESNLTLGSSAAVAGTPGSTMMIIADSTGELRKKYSATGSFVYPIGSTFGTAKYAPVALVFNSGTFGSNAYVGMRTKNRTQPQLPPSINYLGRYWSASSSNITSFSADASFRYNTSDVVGFESSMTAAKWSGTTWSTIGTSDTVNHKLDVTGLAGFSDFTGKDDGLMYRTKSAGSWFTAANWEVSTNGGVSWIAASGYPDAFAGTISVEHAMTVASALTIDQTTVASSGSITVDGATLTVANGTGTDLTIDGGLTMTNSASIAYSPGTASVTVNGTLTYNQDGGTIPDATWATSSTIAVTGVTTNMPAGFDQTFGNVTWNNAGQVGQMIVTGDLTVNGTLSVQAGEIAIGPYVLTLNGGLSISGSGVLTGSVMSALATLVIGGSGPAISLPALSLGSLILNRTNGANLAGAIDVQSVSLESGPLSLGSSTLSIIAGDLYIASGTLVGGPSASLRILGYGATDTIPSIELYELEINRSSGVILGGDVRIDGVLTLSDGLLSIGAYNLTLADSAVAGMGSVSSMVITDGTGQMRQEFSAGQNHTFPVGSNTGTLLYAPVSVAMGSGSFSSGAYIGINAIGTTNSHIAGVSNYLSSYWNMTTSGMTGYAASLMMTYPQASVVGFESFISAAQWTGTSWEEVGTLDSSTNVLTIWNLTSLGEITGLNIPTRYRTTTAGSWSDVSNWEISMDGGLNWGPAVYAPSNLNSVSIDVRHAMTVSSSISVDQVTVDGTGSIALDGATLTVIDGSGTDLTVNGGLTMTNGAAVTRDPVTATIAINGTLTYNQNGGTIPAATWDAASTLSITGVTTTIPSGLNQPVGDLTWNNAGQTGAVTLPGDLTVNGTLSLQAGELAIGANTLTLNDGLSITGTGVLTGGTSSNITVGGTGPAITLPALTLNNLNVTNTNGITLGGTTTTYGTLTTSGGTLALGSNTLAVKGGLDACGTALTGDGSSVLVLDATSTGSIPAGSIGTLTLNRSAGAALCGGFTLATALNLTDGLLTLGTNNLVLGSAATIGGTPGATNMVVTNGTGEMRKEYTAAGSFTFPVGDNTGTAEYSPVTINFTSGSFAGGAYAGVQAIGTTDPNLTGNLNYLSRYWNLTSSGITSYTANTDFTYPQASVVGFESFMTPGQWTGTQWTNLGTVDSTNNVLSITGLTSLGEFTGKDGPAMYRTIASGSWTNAANWEVSFDGGLTWTAAVASPTDMNSVSIDVQNAMTVTTALTIDQTMVGASGSITVDGATLTVADGTGTDLTVNGGLTMTNGAAITRDPVTATIAINGTLTYNQNGGTIPAATWDAASTLSITGVTTTIPSGLNQPVGDLTWNNAGQTGAVTLPGDLTVNGTLSLQAGELAIGANTLTLNDGLSITGTGVLTGGTSSNITVGGTGPAITLPALTLNNLNVTNTNGITLGGTTTTYGTLTTSGGTLALGSNTLTVKGGLDACGTALTGDGSSVLVLDATSTGSIPAGSIGTLTLNRSTGAALCGSITLATALNLTDGLLTLGTNNLVLGSAATIGGTPGATNMVVADGTGEMRKEFTSTGSFTYPIGDNTATAEYTPVYVNVTAGSFGGGAYVGVNVIDAKHASNPALTNYLTRSWSLTQTGITGISYDASFTYMNSDTVGSEDYIYTAAYDGTMWTRFGKTNAALNQLTVSGLSTMYTFTGSSEYASNAQIVVNTKAFLQGPWNSLTDLMDTYLIPDPSDSASVLLPTLHPYGLNTYWSHTGSENVRDLKFFTEHPDIVDWILVELRTGDPASPPMSTIQQRAGFLLASGAVVDLDGISPVAFDSAAIGSYYVVMRHRNHIPIMSASLVSLNLASGLVDLTDSLSHIYGGSAAVLTSTSGTVYGLSSGDGNGDGGVDTGDRINVWLPDNGTAGYLNSDFNLDGGVDTTDRVSFWLPNNGTSTQVP
jgi:riboflavin synthase alpha subunit